MTEKNTGKIPYAFYHQNISPGFLVKDLFLDILSGSVCLKDGTVVKLETIFDDAANSVEIDVQEKILDRIELINIGPNLQRYLDWINSSRSAIRELITVEDDYVIQSTDYTVQLKSSDNTIKADLLENPRHGQMHNIKCILNNKICKLSGNGHTIDNSLVDFTLSLHQSLTVQFDANEPGWIII